jgi:hypothetical protein
MSSESGQVPKPVFRKADAPHSHVDIIPILGYHLVPQSLGIKNHGQLGPPVAFHGTILLRSLCDLLFRAKVRRPRFLLSSDPGAARCISLDSNTIRTESFHTSGF